VFNDKRKQITADLSHVLIIYSAPKITDAQNIIITNAHTRNLGASQPVSATATWYCSLLKLKWMMELWAV